MRSNAVVIGLLALTLGATVFVAVNQVTRPEDDVAGRVAAIDRRLDALEDLMRDTREDARRAARAASTRAAAAMEMAAAREAPRSAAGGDEGEAAAVTAALDAAVADTVQRTVASEMERIAAQSRNRGPDGKWKPPLDEMSQVLELDETQQASLHEIFDAARDEAFALLTTQRTDGGSLLDDFVEDLRVSEDPGRAWARLFAGIATQQVPGRNQTYLAALGEADQRIRERIAGELRGEQTRRFESLNVDVFDVKTGHDPAGDYVRRRLEETSAE